MQARTTFELLLQRGIFDQTTNPNQPKGRLKMTDVETTALAWKLNELTQGRLAYSEAETLIAKLIEAGYAITAPVAP